MKLTVFPVIIFTFILASSKALEIKEEQSLPFQWQVSSKYGHYFKEQELKATKTINGEKIQTNALLIIKDNTIHYEKNYNGFSTNQKQRLWSISKSVSALLLGIAQSKNLLRLDTQVSKYYPIVKKKNMHRITLEHLLTMSSGFRWNEGYENNPFKSNVINMLYLENQKDMASYLSKQSLSYRPGQYFKYSSGETNLAMGMLKKAIRNQESYDNYPWKELFNPIGITDATWEQDRAGTFVGSSYLYLSPRSLARIARLVLSHGAWEEVQLIPKAIIKKSLRPSPASCLTRPDKMGKKYTYGHFWWLNSPCPELPTRKPFKHLPDSTVLALGHHGQTLAIFPQQNAIAIRLGADKKVPFDREAWLNEVFKAIEKIPAQKVIEEVPK